MWHNDYIDPEFISYLNRHFTGIVQLKDKIEKISIFFELAEAFSNQACRFYIDIELFDYENLSIEDKRNANKFFHNVLNETGSKFVSFIYKSQRDYHIDIDIVKSFIYHYQFAVNLFEGFIKNILPANCALEIASLETEPFFNYIAYFLRHTKYSKEEERYSFEREYQEVTKRKFDFDCYYHKRLVNAAVKELTNKENVVTDEELYNAGGGDIAAIREFVVENKVPFSIRYYTDVIDNIHVDASVLKEKISNYIPDFYLNIKPAIILSLIKDKEEVIVQKNRMIEGKCEALAIRLGDYIYVENRYYTNDNDAIGVIKSIDLSYNNELEVRYNTLKKDLQESRLPLKSAREKEIAYTLQSEVFREEKNKGLLRAKEQLIRLFKNKGMKNPLFKTKKKKN